MSACFELFWEGVLSLKTPAFLPGFSIRERSCLPDGGRLANPFSNAYIRPQGQ